MIDTDIVAKLLLPLARLVFTMCIGLLLAGLLESLHWTRFIAKLASPLARLGHLQEVSAASFALAFFSPAASNSLLAEAHKNGELSRKELIFANLFNSSPTFLVHLPTLFSMVFAFIGAQAFVYVGLSFLAAAGRTAATIITGRIMLPPPSPAETTAPSHNPENKSLRDILATTWKRFKKRISKLLFFTVPIYCIFFLLQYWGLFATAEQWLAGHSGWFSFLNPHSVSIIAMYLVAESGAAFSAAASLGNAGALSPHEVILALMVGNIISTPMRAIRHQFPSYAGFYTPSLALVLVVMNQLCRATSLILVTVIYFYW